MEQNNLKAFLFENTIKTENIKYIASKKFINPETKQPMEWELAPLTNEQLDKIQKRNKKRVPIKGTRDFKEVTNQEQIAIDMAIESVQYPPLDNVDLQNSWGVVGEEELLKKMLSPGELTDLYMAVSEACDYESGMADKIKKVKNY